LIFHIEVFIKVIVWIKECKVMPSDNPLNTSQGKGVAHNVNAIFEKLLEVSYRLRLKEKATSKRLYLLACICLEAISFYALSIEPTQTIVLSSFGFFLACAAMIYRSSLPNPDINTILTAPQNDCKEESLTFKIAVIQKFKKHIRLPENILFSTDTQEAIAILQEAQTGHEFEVDILPREPFYQSPQKKQSAGRHSNYNDNYNGDGQTPAPFLSQTFPSAEKFMSTFKEGLPITEESINTNRDVDCAINI
jgi:hypothetical protein